MNVGIEGARGEDHPLPRDDLGTGAYDHGRIDAVLDERIATVTDTRDATVLHPEVRLDDALNGVDDGRVGDHEIQAFVVLG